MALALVEALAPTAASAQTIVSREESTPYPGVRLVRGRTSGPTTRFYAAYVSLCHASVHLRATSEPTGTRTVPSFASATGVELAVNGDFYKTSPLHVYGDAVGGGARWSAAKTGRSTSYSGEWYYQDYGWIAFGEDWVEFSSTKYVKQHRAALGATDGWRPTEVTTDIPAGTKALVSGFPQLLIEGKRFPCVSSTDSGCFPDRSDMRDRHPRTAMGLSRDRQTFLLVVVDGRSSLSAGMYGNELSKLMLDLGAWTAFNLDGGGSSEMWVRGQGTINAPSDGTSRSVLNHWGVFAGTGNGLPDVPGSCSQVYDDVIHQPGAVEPAGASDLDGDGLADACGRAAAGIVCHLSTGAGFGAAIAGPALDDDSGWGDPDNYGTIHYADVTGDGLADVCARANAGLRCWPSTGAGFGAAITGPELSDAAGFRRLSQLATIRLGDVTGDGLADACARDAERFRCWPSTGAGFGAALDGPALGDASGWSEPGRYGTIRLGDLDGDGRADVCARAAGGMRCWRSTGVGFEASAIDGPAWSDADGWGEARHWHTVRLADLDGDRRADLCARGASGLRCHLSTGAGFGPAIEAGAMTEAAEWGDYANYSTLRLADVTGDDRLDACARGDDGVRCWPFDGAAFGAPIVGPMTDANGWSAPRFFRTLQLADVDGDGLADLCGRAAAGLRCWRSLGDRFAADPFEGPAWSDAAGWDEARHYSTIRLVGRARPVPPAPPPPSDGGPGGADAEPGGDDAGLGAADAGPGGPGADGLAGGCGCRVGGRGAGAAGPGAGAAGPGVGAAGPGAGAAGRRAGGAGQGGAPAGAALAGLLGGLAMVRRRRRRR